MKTRIYIPTVRFMLTTLFAMLCSLTVTAKDYITDVMVIGNNDKTKFDNLENSLKAQGWTAINKDLNAGCGSGTDYIHLLYKKASSGTPITDFYIKTGKNSPDSLTHDGRTYHLVSYDGSNNFVDSKGDLNRGAGGDYIHLYYTCDTFPDYRGVTGITFNDTKSGALGDNGGDTGYDLNCGASGDFIYMHLTNNIVYLTTNTGDYQAQHEDVLKGTGGDDTHITIADGATVILSGVDIAIPGDDNHQWAGITCEGNATIIIAESSINTVVISNDYPAIYVPQNKTLTIKGNGTLNATSYGYAAAIGSGMRRINGGNIVIEGGTITAKGGNASPGIGAARESSCGNIQIKGGNITANAQDGASGIGSGWKSSCGTIQISGGTITANGGNWAPGIGSGQNDSSCSDITITGGTVIATGGEFQGAGIGSTSGGSCGNITITNGVTSVTATKGRYSPCSIGQGNKGTCGKVIIDNRESVVQVSPYTYQPSETVVYIVSFNANGGSGTMANQQFASNIPEKLKPNTFTSNTTGYSFMEWNTAADKSGTKYKNEDVIYKSGNLTLYAQWTPTRYDITYILNGGTNASSNPTTYTIESNDITLAEPTLADYVFTGWTWEGQTTPVKNATITHGSTGNKTFTANWKIAPVKQLTNGDITLQDGQTLTGTGGNDTHVTIADGATITLKDATINTINNDNSHKWAGITCLGDATIILEGTNIVKGGHKNYPGIYVPESKTLTIKGNGALDVRSNEGDFFDCAAGIGCGIDFNCGNIVIEGGNINATGKSHAAGIGGSYNGNCGYIIISGGNVNAIGGEWAPGIGCGYQNSTCGDITIAKGITSVTATRGSYSTECIGKSDMGSCGTVSIAEGLADETEEYTRYIYHHLTLSDDADNTLAINTLDGMTCKKVTLSGHTQLFDGNWHTICLPFPLGDANAAEEHHFDETPLAGFTVKELDIENTYNGHKTSLSDDMLYLNFREASFIEAGKPYIIKLENSADIQANPIFDVSNSLYDSLNFINAVPTVDGGEPTELSQSENYNKLVDGYLSTEYTISDADPWVEFHYYTPITPKGYAIWTASNFNGERNPTSWTIKAKNSGDTEWTILTRVNNSKGDKLPMANKERAVFGLLNNNAYQYFRFEATRNKVFQLTDLKFCANRPEMPGLVNPMFTDVTIDSAPPTTITSSDGAVSFKGNYDLVQISNGKDYTPLFLGTDNSLFYPSSTVSIGSCCASFQVANSKLNLGDVNGDNAITVTDVMTIVGHILGKESTNLVIKKADINHDNKINVTDVMALVKFVLGTGNIFYINLTTNIYDAPISYGGGGKDAVK